MVPQEHAQSETFQRQQTGKKYLTLLRALQNHLALVKHLLYVEMIVIQVFEKMLSKYMATLNDQ